MIYGARGPSAEKDAKLGGGGESETEIADKRAFVSADEIDERPRISPFA